MQGPQGTQGVQGVQGSQGTQGVQGMQGPQGTQGVQGLQGNQGTQGVQGNQGTQGIQGNQGTTGIQGNQGTQGTQGVQGVQGIQSMQGTTGIQGIQGVTGASGVSSSYFEYRVDANSQTNSQPSNGHLRYNNATQTSATAIYVNHLTHLGVDIDMFLALLQVNDNVFIQDLNNSNNYQQFKVNGAIIIGSNTYVQIPVTLVASGGTGTTGFPNNHQVILVTTAVGIQGTTGTQGLSGLQGTQGLQGPGTFYTYSSTPPASPAVGDRWVDSDDGVSYTYTYDGNSSAWVELNAIGYAGLQGVPGPQGILGNTGIQGLQGTLGLQGPNGLQGVTGSAIYDLDQAVISMQVFR